MLQPVAAALERPRNDEAGNNEERLHSKPAILSGSPEHSVRQKIVIPPGEMEPADRQACHRAQQIKGYDMPIFGG